MPKRYLIRTHGCQMNEHDSERIAGLFEADGMVPATDVDEADVVVLNTCCIRENADNKLYGTLGHLKSLKAARPELEIVVGGCLAQKDRELIQTKAGHVDVVFGTHNVHRAVELLEQSRTSGPVTEILDAAVLSDDELFPSALPARREIGYQAWVTIQIGCDNSCAFCIVPSVRGAEISKPFGSLLDEVRELAAAGVTEVTLLGQNVNSYGRDLTLKLRGDEPVHRGRHEHIAGAAWADGGVRARSLFPDLLREVGAVDGIRRVRYTSPHPKDFRDDTIAAMAETATVCEHLHLPLQSGSDAILSAMHRGYTADRYLEKVAAARAGIDGLAVTTDIIIGFPGETDADFEATLAVAAEVEYDSAYTFIYSPRPGTEAAELTDRFVDHAVSVDRMNRLRAVVERSSHRRNDELIGTVQEVIVEGPSKKNPDVLTGRTRQNKLCHFAAASPIRSGGYALVEVTGAGLSHLTGEFREGDTRRDASHAHSGRCELTSASTPDVGVAADSPAALVRPDDLVIALSRFLRGMHRSGTGEGAPLPDATAARFIDEARRRVDADLVDPSSFDPPYRPHAPARLLVIAVDLLDRFDAAPNGPVPIVSTTSVPLALGDIRLADGAVVSPTDPWALGDPYADLAFAARDLASVVGPAAVPALFDAYGLARPDPVRIEFWVTIRQLLR